MSNLEQVGLDVEREHVVVLGAGVGARQRQQLPAVERHGRAAPHALARAQPPAARAAHAGHARARQQRPARTAASDHAVAARALREYNKSRMRIGLPSQWLQKNWLGDKKNVAIEKPQSCLTTIFVFSICCYSNSKNTSL